MLSLLLFLQAAALPADTVLPAHDALHYEVTLVPADTGGHILGEVQTTWRLRSGDPVQLLLDSAMRVVRVLVDGRPNTRISRTMYGRSGVDVVVPHQKQAGDSISTRVRYHGTARGGVRLGPNRHGERTAVAYGWPDLARLWLPVPGTPSARVSAAFRVQASAGDRAIAPGSLEKVDTLPYDHATWHYRLDSTAPVASFAAATGPYVVTSLGRAGDLPLELWTWRTDSAAAAVAFRRAAAMADYFSRVLGPSPYGRLTHVEAPIPVPEVAAPGIVLHAESSFAAGGPAEGEIATATARQWLGLGVSSADSADAWLYAELASYLAARWQAEAGGAPLPRSIPGAPRLSEIRAQVGDSVFTDGLRRFYREHGGAAAGSADFARTMASTSGKDLDRFFREAPAPPASPAPRAP